MHDESIKYQGHKVGPANRNINESALIILDDLSKVIISAQTKYCNVFFRVLLSIFEAAPEPNNNNKIGWVS